MAYNFTLDGDLLNQYYALMYRWCLLVSKADKTTTVQEQAWLLKLKDVIVGVASNG